MPHCDTTVADYNVQHVHAQKLFSVDEFLHVAAHDYSDQDHDTRACVLNLDMAYFKSRVVYRLLHSDVLIFDQDVVCYEAESSPVAANPVGKHYLFIYVYELNLPMKIVLDNYSGYMNKGFFGFCSNYGGFETILPAGFHGKYLQVLVQHDFLEKYIDLSPLSQSTIKDIVLGQSTEMLTLPVMPSGLKNKFNRLIDVVHQPVDKPFDKLNALNVLTQMLKSFLSLSLHGNRRLRASSTPVSAADISAYLSEMVEQPFPGLDYLAHQFGTSVSTLKRVFQQTYDTTIHQYFTQLQVAYAKERLLATQTPIADIAYQLGFDSPGNFTRSFKKETGMSPADFRKQLDLI